MNTKIVLVLNIVLMVAVPLFFIELITFQATKELLDKEVDHHLDMAADVAVERIELFVQRQHDAFVTVLSQSQLRLLLAKYRTGEDAVVIQRVLLEIVPFIKGTNGAILLDDKGTILASTNKYENDAFLTTLAQEGVQGYVTLTREEQGVLQAYTAGPIPAKDQITVLVIVSDAQVLKEIMSSVRNVGSTGNAYLYYTKNGSIRFLTSNTIPFPSALYDFASKNPAEKSNVIVNDVIFAAAKKAVPSAKWSFMVIVDDKELHRPIYSLRMIFVMVAALVVLFAAFMGGVVARTIADPIVELSRVVDEISKGNFTVKIDRRVTSSNDELRKLSESFARIIVSMKLAVRKTFNPPQFNSSDKKKEAFISEKSEKNDMKDKKVYEKKI